MAVSNEIPDRSDSRRDPSESAKSLSQTKSGETKESVKKRDEEWGFEPGKGGMAVEAKMGMGIVVILLCAFAFLVYHKFDLKQRALLQANIENKQTIPPDSTEETQQALQTMIRDQQQALSEFNPPETAATEALLTAANANSGYQRNDAQAAATLEVANDAPPFDLAEPEPPALDATPVVAADTSLADDFVAAQQPTEDPFALLAAQNKAREMAQADAAPHDPRDPFAGAAATPTPEPPPPLFPTFDSEPEVATTAATEPPAALADPSHSEDVVTADDVPMNELFPAFGAPESSTPAPSEPEVVLADEPSGLKELPPATPVSNTREVASLPDNTAEPKPSFNPFSESAPEEPPAFADASAEIPAEPAFGNFEPENSLGDSPMLAMADPQPGLKIYPDGDDESASTNTPAPEPTSDLQAYQRPEPTPEPRTFGGESRFDRDVQAAPSGQPVVIGNEPVTTSDAAFAFEPVPIPSEATAPPKQAKPNPAPSFTPAPQQRAQQKAAPGPQFGIAQFTYENGIRTVAASSDDCDICEVQPNDNYWTISKRAYGTSRYFSALALYNQHRVKDPRKLRPGMKVLIPNPQELETKYPELFREFQEKTKQPAGYFLQKNGTPAYRVGEKETLSEISQKHLGRASRWMQIYRMNESRLKDPNHLKPGTVLVLPDDATDVNIVP